VLWALGSKLPIPWIEIPQRKGEGMSTHEFDWQRYNQRILRLEALADEVRDYCHASDFKDLLDARQRLRRALLELDRSVPPVPEARSRPIEVTPADVPLQADLSRRKRVYESLLRTVQTFTEITEGTG